MCPNCGTRVDADGWVVTVGAKEGAVLTVDHTCPECGAGFWYDPDDEDEPQDPN
jgi:ribosomal protein S27AE